ncbi:hypothetical protein L596_019988 [Steinernema carpocapsae]|uniref:5'-nucleotidase n=1 Tax=Steinernema carpocapsae TaxID=34508 RepID=A0A4U5MSV0_STECR|nr:hypothetical protein L596_019988 [Steinernema carpocapsae]
MMSKMRTSKEATPKSDEKSSNAYKRDPSQRVFVGRSLRLNKIKFFGFDMDYTLAYYKSPDYETMLFNRLVERMIAKGYPEDLKKFTYDSSFPVRGLWFDQLYGNLLKVDSFGNILVGVHGFRFMKAHEIEEFYPNKFLHHIQGRVIILNTLFHLSEMHLLAALVHYFDSNSHYKPTANKTGVHSGDVFMSYKSIAQDLQSAVDAVHNDGQMKQYVLENVEKYVVKDERIKAMLPMLRKNGSQTFLLTNSEYYYTNGIMTYLIGPDWTSYFDLTVVDAKKPLWFAEGTVFRQVDVKTGSLKIGIHKGPLKKGQVYSGGSCDAFRELVKARGKDVLYIGDHIFGDVLRSKKTRGWRTFLVVPELEHELTVWTERHQLFEQLSAVDKTLGKLYKNLDGASDQSCQVKPMIDDGVKVIRKLTHEMDQAYGRLGSLFRSGSRTTFFASQVERYADLYASSCYNLIYYPVFYFFRAPMMLMPHESTVDHSVKMMPPKNPKSPAALDRKGSITTTHLCHEEEEDEVSKDQPNRITSPEKTSESEAAMTNNPTKSFTPNRK